MTDTLHIRIVTRSPSSETSVSEEEERRKKNRGGLSAQNKDSSTFKKWPSRLVVTCNLKLDYFYQLHATKEPVYKCQKLLRSRTGGYMGLGLALKKKLGCSSCVFPTILVNIMIFSREAPIGQKSVTQLKI